MTSTTAPALVTAFSVVWLVVPLLNSAVDQGFVVIVHPDDVVTRRLPLESRHTHCRISDLVRTVSR